MAPDNAAAQINLAEALSKTHGDNYGRPILFSGNDARPGCSTHPLQLCDALTVPRAYLKRLGILPITTLASQTRCTGANPHGAALPQRTVCWKTLLVCSEQELGDAVRLAPYLHRLSELADTVIMEFDPRMLPIYQRSIPVIKLYPFRRTRVRDRMRFTYA